MASLPTTIEAITVITATITTTTAITGKINKSYK
jgi:hypothetical protein